MIGPGFDLKRGRGGIREVEFFIQIQQMIHGGRDPSVRAPATLDAIGALVASGPAGRGDRRRTRRGLSAASDDRASRADGRRRADPLLAGRARRRSTMSRSCTGSRRRRRLLDLLRPRVERVGAIFDGLAPRRASRQLSNDPRHPGRRAPALGFADPEAAARHVADWRSGKARSLRSPPRSRRSRRCCRACSQAIAAGADPDRALNRLERHRRAAVERGELVPAARGASAACRAARQDARPRARAGRSARRGGPSCSKGCSTRRASRCRRPPASSPSSWRRRCAASRTMSRSTGSGGWSTSAGSRSACS